MRDALLLGIDGGGTQCRARLCTLSGTVIGEGIAGPANVRLGFEESFAAVAQAAEQCLATAGLNRRDAARVSACLALAGATEPATLAAARKRDHPFRAVLITSDVHAACVGAHRGRDGGVVVVGTGSVGWGEREGRHVRVGGWGFPVSDEGSGAWLGCEAVRQVLWAHDGRAVWTGLLDALFERLGSDPHAVVQFMGRAKPRDFARFAPRIVEHASRADSAGETLMRGAALHIEALAQRLIAFGVDRLSLVGGLSGPLRPWLPLALNARLVPPAGDALEGALRLARSLAAPANADAMLATLSPEHHL